MKVASLFLIVLALSSVFFACTLTGATDQAKPLPVGDYRYTGYDKEGTRIVEGLLSITSVEPRRNKNEGFYSIKGHWRLNSIGSPGTIGPQVGSGDLVGSIEKAAIYVDLNPRMNDNNVTLQSTIEGNRLHGTWRYSGFIGEISGGTFEAIRK